MRRSLDLRYAGQSYELTVPIAATADGATAGRFLPAFHRAHRRRYGHADLGRAVEVVAVRLRAELPGAAVRLPPLPKGSGDAQAARLERQPVWFDGKPRATWLYDRNLLRAGDGLRGPALILQLDATTVIPPGWGGRVDDVGNLLLEAER